MILSRRQHLQKHEMGLTLEPLGSCAISGVNLCTISGADICTIIKDVDICTIISGVIICTISVAHNCTEVLMFAKRCMCGGSQVRQLSLLPLNRGSKRALPNYKTVQFPGRKQTLCSLEEENNILGALLSLIRPKSKSSLGLNFSNFLETFLPVFSLQLTLHCVYRQSYRFYPIVFNHH